MPVFGMDSLPHWRFRVFNFRKVFPERRHAFKPELNWQVAVIQDDSRSAFAFVLCKSFVSLVQFLDAWKIDYVVPILSVNTDTLNNLVAHDCIV